MIDLVEFHRSMPLKVSVQIGVGLMLIYIGALSFTYGCLEYLTVMVRSK